MPVSEASPPRRDRVEGVGDGLYRTRFLFQVRNGTVLEHFVRDSKRYRRLSRWSDDDPPGNGRAQTINSIVARCPGALASGASQVTTAASSASASATYIAS